MNPMSTSIFWVKSQSGNDDEQQVDVPSSVTVVDQLKSVIISQLRLDVVPRLLSLFITINGTTQKLSPRTELSTLPAGVCVEYLIGEDESRVPSVAASRPVNRVAWDVDEDFIHGTGDTMTMHEPEPESSPAAMCDEEVLEFDTEDWTPPVIDSATQTTTSKPTPQSLAHKAAVISPEVRAGIVCLRGAGVDIPDDATVGWLVSNLNSEATNVMRDGPDGLEIAHSLLKCAENVCRCCGGGALADLVVTIGNTANLHKLRNEHGTAHQRYQMCYQLQLTLGDRVGAAMTLLNAAGMLMKQKLITDALKLAQDSINLLETCLADKKVQLLDADDTVFTDEDSVHTCLCLSQALRSISLMFLTHKQLQQALESLEKALIVARALTVQRICHDILKIRQYNHECALVTLDQGKFHMAQRKPHLALPFFTESVALLRDCELNDDCEAYMVDTYVLACNLTATVYAMGGKFHEAHDLWVRYVQVGGKYSVNIDSKVLHNISTCEEKMKVMERDELL